MKMDGKNEFIHSQNQDNSIVNVKFALRVYFFVSQSETLPSETCALRWQGAED